MDFKRHYNVSVGEKVSKEKWEKIFKKPAKLRGYGKKKEKENEVGEV